MRSLAFLALASLLGCSGGPSTGAKDTTATDTSGRDQDADRDGYPASSDCDDNDPSIHPDAAEVCDGIDNDCDDLIDEMDPDLTASTWYTDADGDGYGDDASAVVACTQPMGTITTGGDCNDSDPAYHPGASETDCTDPNDYNCDGSTGADDVDGDGFPACEDCNDADASISPSAAEICDGVDNDCDGLVDDADTEVSGGTLYYVDEDGDGYGTDDMAEAACTQPAGTSTTGGDCNDSDAAYHPGAEESDCSDPHDYNCDGSVAFADADGDGVAACADCDDSNAAVYPGATEVCDGIDNDCDGAVDDNDSDVTGKLSWYADGDGDGYGFAESVTEACTGPAGTVSVDGDCDDLDALINPGATEICDEVDNDCDGLIDDADPSVTGTSTWYADADSDSFGNAASSKNACSQPTGYVATSTDCNDSNAAISPGGTEICDSLDDDCDGLIDDADPSLSSATTWYADADGDGYGSTTSTKTACTRPTGYQSTGTDCNDSSAAINPGKSETCNGVDDDCDGLVDDADPGITGASTWYADADGDKYGDPTSSVVACSKPSGYVADDTDCDDSEKSINPGKDEKCDALDNDCSGSIDDGDVCPCTTDWYGDHAYMFCDDYANWSDASSSCETYGYTLVTIDNSDENTFVYDDEYSTSTWSYWWIGLNDSASEGTYVWADGSTSTYRDWSSGEPDGGKYSDCDYMYPYRGTGWGDYYCSSYMSYVCETN